MESSSFSLPFPFLTHEGLTGSSSPLRPLLPSGAPLSPYFHFPLLFTRRKAQERADYARFIFLFMVRKRKEHQGRSETASEDGQEKSQKKDQKIKAGTGSSRGEKDRETSFFLVSERGDGRNGRRRRRRTSPEIFQEEEKKSINHPSTQAFPLKPTRGAFPDRRKSERAKRRIRTVSRTRREEREDRREKDRRAAKAVRGGPFQHSLFRMAAGEKRGDSKKALPL